MTQQSLHNLTEGELIDLLTELERIKERAEEALFQRMSRSTRMSGSEQRHAPTKKTSRSDLAVICAQLGT